MESRVNQASHRKIKVQKHHVNPRNSWSNTSKIETVDDFLKFLVIFLLFIHYTL